MPDTSFVAIISFALRTALQVTVDKLSNSP